MITKCDLSKTELEINQKKIVFFIRHQHYVGRFLFARMLLLHHSGWFTMFARTAFRYESIYLNGVLLHSSSTTVLVTWQKIWFQAIFICFRNGIAYLCGHMHTLGGLFAKYVRHPKDRISRTWTGRLERSTIVGSTFCIKLLSKFRCSKPADNARYLHYIQNNFIFDISEQTLETTETQVLFDRLYEYLHVLLDQFLPLKTVTITSRDPPYVTPQVKHL